MTRARVTHADNNKYTHIKPSYIMYIWKYFEAEKIDAIFYFLEENFPYAPTGELVDMSYCK